MSQSALTVLFLVSLLPAAPILHAAQAPTTQPTLKPGYWQIITTSTTQPGDIVVQTKSFLCRSSAFDDFAAAQLKVAAPGCTTLSDTTKSNTHAVLSACQTKLYTSFTSSVFAVLTATSAHAEIDTSYNPATAGILTITHAEDETYVSACPTGMSPGDLTLSDGTVQHLWTP